jgi:hypothetical protein
MSGTTVAPAVLLALALGLIVGALRCLADRLLMSALLYAAAAATAAGIAGKIALDAL